MPTRDAPRPPPPPSPPDPAPDPAPGRAAPEEAPPADAPGWRGGVVDGLPLLLGALPFGLVAGMTGVAVGLPPFEAIAMGALVFAGTSQLAGLQLIADGSPAALIVATTALINLRFSMYSATLVGRLRATPRLGRALAAYLLTDQAFALATLRYRERSESPRRRLGYFLGGGAVVWVGWMVAIAAGALVGAGLPDSWRIDFAVPLMFLALLVPAVRSRAELVAAVVGGGVALAARDLPMNLGLMAGALAGVAAGVAASAGEAGAAEESGADAEADDRPGGRP